MASYFYSLILVLLINSYHSLAQNGQSPLCTQCTCTGSKDKPGIVDADCSEKLISLGFLHDKATWFDSSDKPYPFGIMNMKASDLGNLYLQFPFSNLTYLDMSENMINKINDSYFAQLQNMKVLILSKNNIETLRPDVFRGIQMDGDDYPLRSLTTLKLDSNRLHTLHQDLFKHLEERLEILDLSYNPFKVLDQSTVVALGSITYLKELNLGFTSLKEIPDHFFHTPKYLKVVDLSGNLLEAVPTALSEAHSLETLYFNNNPIVNLTTENGFPNISTLKVLHMCEMITLESIEAHSMSRLMNLEELHICNNMRLTNLDPAALTALDEKSETWPPLKKLYLQDNELTTLDFHFMLHWENLEALDIRYNPWSCDCDNEWFIDELMPIYLKLDENMAKEIRCEAPVEMKDKTFYDEYHGNKSMRCKDLYGNRPERDAAILIGVLVGLLIGIPLILFMVFAYQRHWFGLFDNSPAAFSRQFYSRTRSEEL